LRGFRIKLGNSWIVFEICDNRRFFRSEAGRLGWGPDPLRGGHVVCGLNRMDVPLVLRKLGEGFEVLSNVYVHGSMDSEATDAGKEEIPLI
jgi:hypothetical protein